MRNNIPQRVMYRMWQEFLSLHNENSSAAAYIYYYQKVIEALRELGPGATAGMYDVSHYERFLVKEIQELCCDQETEK